MKKWIISTVGFGLFILVGSTEALYTVDVLMLEAHTKKSQGDLEGAALAYKKILELDQENNEARQGLTNVLIEAQSGEYYSENSEAVSAITEGI